MDYVNDYVRICKLATDFEEQTDRSVGSMIKAISVTPVTIGDMVFFYEDDDDGFPVPTCKRVDGSECFRSIRKCYSDYIECCRIYNLIYNKLMEE